MKKRAFALRLFAVLLIGTVMLTGCAAVGGLPGVSTGPSHTTGEVAASTTETNVSGTGVLPEPDTSAPSDTVTPSTTTAEATTAESTTKAPAQVEPTQSPPQPTTKPSTPTSGAEVRLSFLAAGDNIIHGNIYDDARLRAKNGATYTFDDMYTDIAELVRSADIALVNQETPIAGSEFKVSGYPNFNTPPEAGQSMVNLGFDIVTLANNHMLDKGEKGYINSIAYWKEMCRTNPGLLYAGAYENADDYENIRIYEKDGIKIAVLAYTYGTNGMVLPSGSKMVIPTIDKAVMTRHVQLAKQKADLVFAVMHWGAEDAFEPVYDQRDAAQHLVDLNVDVIIGMHPHVIEPVKWVDRPDGKKTLLIYSLGNLISTMNPGRNMLGGLMKFDVCRYSNGTFGIENPLFIPIITHYDKKRHNLQVYQFEHYTDALAKAHGCNDQPQPFGYDYILGLIKKYIDPAFLPAFYTR